MTDQVLKDTRSTFLNRSNTGSAFREQLAKSTNFSIKRPNTAVSPSDLLLDELEHRFSSLQLAEKRRFEGFQDSISKIKSQVSLSNSVVEGSKSSALSLFLPLSEMEKRLLDLSKDLNAIPGLRKNSEIRSLNKLDSEIDSLKTQTRVKETQRLGTPSDVPPELLLSLKDTPVSQMFLSLFSAENDLKSFLDEIYLQNSSQFELFFSMIENERKKEEERAKGVDCMVTDVLKKAKAELNLLKEQRQTCEDKLAGLIEIASIKINQYF